MAEARPPDFLVCPDDFNPLEEKDGGLVCTGCARFYEVREGVPVLLPKAPSEIQQRYLHSYEKIARDDLERPLEELREIRHRQLLDFIGDVRGRRVLDVGSSNGLYLRRLDASLKVALDIALPFLQAIDRDSGIVPVCADAERLPVKPGFFDVVILSDVLEHVLEPQNVAARLQAVCRPDTRVIVEVPWEEDLAPYRDSPWEFTHLRSFNEYQFSRLMYWFKIVRRTPTWPRLKDPILFRVGGRLPGPLYNALRWGYFHRGLAAGEYEARKRWIAELPRRQGRLLRFYPPYFYQFELRPLAGSWEARAYDRVSGWARALSRRARRPSDVVEEHPLGPGEEPAAHEQEAARDEEEGERLEEAGHLA